MAGSRSQQDFSEFLSELKQRSGLSYERIGQKTNLSRSSVHRYCGGGGFPQEFGTAERIAKVCGANRDELNKLYRLWSQAGEIKNDSGNSTPNETAAYEPSVSDRKRVGIRARCWVPVAAGMLVAVIVAAYLARGERPAAVTPGISAASWAQAPTPVPTGFFGVTINSSTGAMPTFQTGAVRLWDSRTRWANLQARRGEFDWSILDRLVAAAEQRALPVMFTMGGTPEWASPTGPRTAYDDGSRTSAPDDLADWDAFVRAVSERYQGRIEAYELWVLANDPRFYSGDVRTLVEMTRRANGIIKGVDPKATVVCPSMGQLWKPEGRAVLEQFAAMGGYDHCDAAGVKLYQRQASDPPETMVELAGEIDRAFHRAGAHPRLWSTGTTYDIALAEPLEPERASDYAARFYMVGLYAQMRRMYFYNWGGTKIPIVLQPVGGSPTQAGLYVEELQRWLRGASITGCGMGSQAALPSNVWECRFVGADGKEAVIRWAHEGAARMSAAGKSAVHSLDGASIQVSTGDAITVTGRPVLITSG
ncbi:helix-turn-helix domain-containing protein [Streptomyces sp. NPDC058611]|uniref:helix-turn-helix domain-containing protein n=1 Tax=unclassified Streptomyces TaxID=2593676 RepID=UPI00365730B9